VIRPRMWGCVPAGMRPSRPSPAINPADCDHRNVQLVHNGFQEDGEGGGFDWYTCTRCRASLSEETLEAMVGREPLRAAREA
jgi:hypothetical protein